MEYVTVARRIDVPKTACRADGAKQNPVQSHRAALAISVVFTDVQSTLAALTHAAKLASELAAEIRIIVPQVVPYPLTINEPPVSCGHLVRRLRTISSTCAIPTRAEIYLCRDCNEVFKRALRPESLVIVGGRKHWWRTRESRAAKALERAGHHVIFVRR